MINISIELFFHYCPLYLEKIHYHCRGIELSLETVSKLSGGRQMKPTALDLKKSESSPEAQNKPADGQPPKFLVFYVIGLFIGTVCVMAALIYFIPHKTNLADLEPFIQTEGRRIFIFTAAMMAGCGVLGGCLYDIRGLIKHSINEDFEQRYSLSYVLRPIAGSLTGLIAFFLLLGGALTFTTNDITKGAGWTTFAGRMPYLAVGLLAGYSSQVFMMKLKDIADAIFAPKNLKSGKK